MDEMKKMILVKGEDRTADIASVEPNPFTKKTKVTFKGGRTYSYNAENVRILKLKKEIVPEGQVVYVDGVPEYRPKKIFDFGSKIRIHMFNGGYKTVERTAYSFVNSSGNTETAEAMMRYLKEISSFLKEEEYDEAFLLKELKRLDFVHPDSVLNSFLSKQSIQRQQTDSLPYIFPFRFNLSQKAALEKALSWSLSVIDGPPGTGKTQTILNILANLIIRRKSVAVVSNNSEAVKNIIEKMDKDGYGFLNALLGRKDFQENFFKALPKAKVRGWNCKESKDELAKRISQLDRKLQLFMKQEREMVQLKQSLDAWKLEQQYFEKYFESQKVEKLVSLPLFCKFPNRLISFIADTTVAAEYGISEKFSFKLKLLFKYGIFDLKKLNQDEETLLLSLQKEFYKSEIQSVEKKIQFLEKQLQRVSFEELLQQHREDSEKLFRKYVFETHRQIDVSGFTKENFKKNFKRFLKAYPIILSTTHSLRRSIPENFLLDYVIIDESSQVDLITGVLALSCCKNLIIVGDEKQLAQITQEGKIKKQIKSEPPRPEFDYFRHSILSSVLCLYGKKLPRTILREHYRCHPQIINFCNQEYYGGALIPYTDASMAECPFILYRTAEGNHMRQVTKGEGKGIYNQRELDSIVNEVLKNPELTEIGGSIGVVTPFRKQADKAAELLSGGIQSDTTHGYQGRERDTMIMSTVLDSSGKSMRRIEFVDDGRMMNVAVSRAVKQFILVTDHDLFFQKGKHVAHLIRYILYNTLDEKLIDSKIVSVFDLLYQKYSPKLISLKKKMDPNAKWKSEEAVRVLLEEILQEEEYFGYSYRPQVLLRNLINDMSLLTDEEGRFVNQRASVDFVIYRKQDKTTSLVIEVDGFAFHENNPRQLQRDTMKDKILKQYGIPVLRLPTNASGIEEKIKGQLMKISD